MTNQEVLAELRSRTKPYIGIMKQGAFANMLKRIAAGTMKPGTMRVMLAKFGFAGDYNTWEQMKSPTPEYPVRGFSECGTLTF